MAEPLKYKIENGLASYLGTIAALSAFTIQAGQNPLSLAPPCISVFLNSMREAWPDAKPKLCEMQVEVVTLIDTDTDADNEAGENVDRTANFQTHRTALQAVEAALQGLTAIQSYLNKTNVTNRPVSDFYVYDIFEENQSSTFAGEDRVFISIIQVTVLCEAQDN